jgi:hypothetical protein
VTFGKWEFQFNGRAIFQLAMGAAFIFFPALLASAASQPTAITPSPRDYQTVDTIPEPSYTAFTFIRDTSILDLREEEKAAFWRFLPFVTSKSHPATLTNIMTIRKTAAADTISFTYGTSGTLDVRCLTHRCRLRRAVTADEHPSATLTDTWELTANVAGIPVGGVFEMVVEATYWQAFNGSDKQWFATYPNTQKEDESVAVLLLFPHGKPFTSYSIWSHPHGSKDRQRFAGTSTVVPGPDDLSLYWDVPAAQGTDTLEIHWEY